MKESIMSWALIAVMLPLCLIVTLLCVAAAGCPDTVNELSTTESTYLEEEFVDPSEWFVTDEKPSQFTEETYPLEMPTEAPTEPEPNFVVFDVPKKYNKKDFKSYEDYRAIKVEGMPHLFLQRYYAYTEPNGIRAIEDRYCIALGSYFTTEIGQYIDVVLENGTVIECILGDQKADRHTDDKHIAHLTDGSVVEFIIDKDVMNDRVEEIGNISFLYEEWKSPVVQIIVYDINIFDIYGHP